MVNIYIYIYIYISNCLRRPRHRAFNAERRPKRQGPISKSDAAHGTSGAAFWHPGGCVLAVPGRSF